jgi:hypothetical protein
MSDIYANSIELAFFWCDFVILNRRESTHS